MQTPPLFFPPGHSSSATQEVAGVACVCVHMHVHVCMHVNIYLKQLESRQEASRLLDKKQFG